MPSLTQDPSEASRIAAYLLQKEVVRPVTAMFERRISERALLNLRLLGAAIASLSGDRGAGPLLAGRSDVIEIDGDPSTSLDIDTRDALAQAEDHFARLASLRQRSEQ